MSSFVLEGLKIQHVWLLKPLVCMILEESFRQHQHRKDMELEIKVSATSGIPFIDYISKPTTARILKKIETEGGHYRVF